MGTTFKKTLFFALILTGVLFAQETAPAAATTTDPIPTNLIGWFLFIGLKTPILGVFQRVLKALPQNAVVKFLLSIVDLLAANTSHVEK